MLDTFLPPVLPPAGVVAELSADAAAAITEFRQFDATLPARRSAEQLNTLEEVRGKALQALGGEFFADLEREEAELRAALGEQLEQVMARWGRLEQIRGLKAWWREGMRAYKAAPIAAMTIASGVGGYRQSLYGRALLKALSDTIEGG